MSMYVNITYRRGEVSNKGVSYCFLSPTSATHFFNFLLLDVNTVIFLFSCEELNCEALNCVFFSLVNFIRESKLERKQKDEKLGRFNLQRKPRTFQIL